MLQDSELSGEELTVKVEQETKSIELSLGELDVVGGGSIGNVFM